MFNIFLLICLSLLATSIVWVNIRQNRVDLSKEYILAYSGCAGLISFAVGIGVLFLVAIFNFFEVSVTWWLILIGFGICVYHGCMETFVLVKNKKKPRRGYERVITYFFQFCALVAVLVTIGIVFAVLGESVRFFTLVPVHEYLFGTEWSPQIAIREDQAGSSGSFGVIPILLGTILISLVAMAVAVPLGLLSAIYQSEFASFWVRNRVKPTLEFLAGIPTVVYGFFAVITLGPFLRDLGNTLGVSIASESALAAGFVIGVMIIPFIASLTEDALHAIPDDLRLGSLALGATKAETAIKVAVPAALPGISAGILLAFSRAIGETMIVVMAAGLAANLTINPLEAVTTMTTQIVTLLIGDQEFDDPKTLAAFALGLTLFVFTLILNVLALRTVRKYHEHYE